MALFALGSRHPRGDVLSALERGFCLAWSNPSTGLLTFLDTFDWRLFNKGYTLALARKGGPSILRLEESGGGEWEARVRRLPDFAEGLPEGPLREKLLPVSGIRRLLPLARVAWTAHEGVVLNDDGKTVVRLRLAEGVASHSSSRIREPMPTLLEVRALKGYKKDHKAVLSLLWREFGLRPSRKGEMALAMEATGQIPGLDLSSPEIPLTPEMGGAEAARTIHRALLSVMLHTQDGLLRELDPEFLHDFRVAIRRIRATLGQMKGVFPPGEVKRFGGEFRWLGSRTGPTRDMDVYLLKIPAYQAALPEGVRDHLEPLVRFLEHKKGLAHGGLVRTLNTKRYKKLLRDWGEFLEGPDAAEEDLPNARTPVLRLARERIWKVYKRVLRDGSRAGEKGAPAPAETLHMLRIECKRLRYLMGIFQSLFPPDRLRPILKELKRLQDTLGDFNDLHVQQVALRGFADEMLESRGGPPETLMAMGRLMGQLETQQEVERGSFHQRFTDFGSPRNVRRFRRLFKPDERMPEE